MTSANRLLSEIVELVQSATDGFVILRRLLRHRNLDNTANARLNELVYSGNVSHYNHKLRHKLLPKCQIMVR